MNLPAISSTYAFSDKSVTGNEEAMPHTFRNCETNAIVTPNAGDTEMSFTQLNSAPTSP